jgi:hypothetical protein
MKKFVWFGYNSSYPNMTQVFYVVWKTLRFVIFRYKNLRRVPNPIMIDNDLIFQLKTTIFSVRGNRALCESVPVLARLIRALG